MKQYQVKYSKSKMWYPVYAFNEKDAVQRVQNNICKKLGKAQMIKDITTNQVYCM